jgi:hypothetical protein
MAGMSARQATLFIEPAKCDLNVRLPPDTVAGDLVLLTNAARQGCTNRHNQTDPLPGFPSGRLTSSNVATWVLSNQDSSVAPQTLQDA